MTKADLVEKVTRLGDLTRRDGEVIVETVFDSVISALQSGDKIEIRGLGSFRIRQRNPRIGRNPKTGERFFYRCWKPCLVSLATLVRVAGRRWTIEMCQPQCTHIRGLAA